MTTLQSGELLETLKRAAAALRDASVEFAVGGGRLSAGNGQPAVTVTATAADLITARMGSTATKRKAALRRVKFEGEADAVTAMRTAFALSGDPGVLVGRLTG